MNGAKVLLCLVALGAATGVQNDAIKKLKGMMGSMQSDVQSQYDGQKKEFNDSLCLLHSQKVDAEIGLTNTNLKLSKAQASVDQYSGSKDAAAKAKARLESEVKKAREALDTATSQRQEEQRSYQEGAAERTKNVPMIKGALQRLEKGNSFLQKHPMAAAQLSALTQLVGAQDENAASDLKSLIQTGAGSSGEVVGILKQMLEDMQEEGKAADAEEGQKGASYAEVKANYRKEIDATQAELDATMASLQDASINLTQSSIERDNFSKQKDELETNLDENRQATGKTQSDKDATLTKLSADLQAIGEAFTTVNDASFVNNPATLLQINSRAAKQLEKMGARFGNQAYMQLATKIRSDDTFAEVFEAIDGIISKLKKDQTMDDNDLGECHDTINTMKVAERKLHNNVEGSKAAVNKHTASLNKATGAMSADSDAKAELSMQMQKTSEMRVAHSKEFQTAFSNNAAAMAVLNMAKNKLMERFDAHNPVVVMFVEVVQDLNATNKAEQKAESDSVSEYSQYFENANEQQNTLMSNILASKEVASNSDVAKSTSEGEYDEFKKAHGHKKNELNNKQGNCKFIMNNHGVRADNRKQEQEGLVEAKAMLKGMDF